MYGELKLALFIYLWYPKTKVRKLGDVIIEANSLYVI